MKSRPIIFTGDMAVKANTGEKTETRRPITYTDENGKTLLLPYSARYNCLIGTLFHQFYLSDSDSVVGFRCPYGVPGDELWVREAFAEIGGLLYWDDEKTGPPEGCGAIAYRADSEIRQYSVALKEPEEFKVDELDKADQIKWKPSIHMPRWASRTTLIVLTIRAERLQQVTKAGVFAEGINEREGYPLKDCHAGWHEPFAQLWSDIYAKKPELQWNADPWVWVIGFERKGK